MKNHASLEVVIVSVLPLVALFVSYFCSCRRELLSAIVSVILHEHLAQTCLPLHDNTIVNLPGVLQPKCGIKGS